MWSLTGGDSHDDFRDIYENRKIQLQNLVWIDRLTFILLYGLCFLITLLFSFTKWIWWVKCFSLFGTMRFCQSPWSVLSSDSHFSAFWLPVLCVHCCFFSLFSHHFLCLGYFIFLRISSSSSFPFSSLNCVCNAIQLLSCSPLCQNLHFLRKQRPPSAGNHWFHVHRRETLLSAQCRSCLSTTVGQLL